MRRAGAPERSTKRIGIVGTILVQIRFSRGRPDEPEVHHAFCFVRRYRGAAAGFRLGGDGAAP